MGRKDERDREPIEGLEHMRLNIPRDLRYLGVVRRAVTAAAQRCGFTPRVCAQIEMAVDEACANAVRHGCRSRRNAVHGADALAIEIVRDAGGLTVTVCDCAEPISVRFADDKPPARDARAVPEAADLAAWYASPQPGGLGLCVIERFMDEVEWQGHAPHGRRLRLRKRLAAGV